MPTMQLLPRLVSKIAEGLRDFGYPDVTADLVLDELKKPDAERNIIGKMASTILEDGNIGWTKETTAE